MEPLEPRTGLPEPLPATGRRKPPVAVTIPAPAHAPSDLRTALRLHLARRAVEALQFGEAAREWLVPNPGGFESWRERTLAAARQLIGVSAAELSALPLNAEVVSRHERRHHLIENVLFDSLEGWQAAATVFLPRVPSPSGRYPAIIVPCGHSAKTHPAHQIPPQVFARAGYAAILIEPVGQGEKAPGNDHFADGVRGYAVGLPSNRYFVADALRAIDYMASRDDIDVSRGVAMTGVSGGGHTTMWAALLDDRIRVLGPACCAGPHARHPIRNLYAFCPETHPPGRYDIGLDDADLMAAAAPRPQLYLYGMADEIYGELGPILIEQVARVYRAARAGGQFDGFAQDCGHDYTPEMARAFVRFVDRHLLGEPEREHGEAFDEDPEPEPAEALRCGPRAEPNMRTISAARAEVLRDSRPRLAGRADAAKAVRTLVRRTGRGELMPRRVLRGSRTQAVMSDLEEVALEYDRGIVLPASVLWPRRRGVWPVVVMFDDRGRWGSLQKQGWLATVSRYVDREPSRGAAPIVMSVDLRGWGDTAVAPSTYDLTGWSGTDRWASYISAALSEGLLAQRVRDALLALRWLLDNPGVDDTRVVLAGHGLGGWVALMTAALVEQAAGVVCVDTPYSLEAIVRAPRYAWPADAFLPGMLERFDIPALVDALAPVLQVRPRDEEGNAMREEPDEHIAPWVWQRLAL